MARQWHEYEENSLRATLVSCLTQQLSEYELLKSMYPEYDAVVLTDPKSLEELNEFISGSTDYKPSHLDYILKIFFEKLKCEVSVNLPSFYPDHEEPDIYVRCNQLTRVQETNLNERLAKHMENFKGEVSLHSALSWLNDNIESVACSGAVANENKDATNENSEENISGKFSRFWIYSHHIYNKRKREEIVRLARELNLTGFCLSGKPGIVCIEGPEIDCKEWWKTIKCMNWKKIVVRKIELFELKQQFESQKFLNFKEIHLNMGQLSKYLAENGLDFAFQEIFGFNDDDSKK